MTQPAYLRWLHWEPGKNPRDPEECSAKSAKTPDLTPYDPEERSAKSAKTPDSTPSGTFGTPIRDTSPKRAVPTPDPGPEHSRDLVAAQAPGRPGAKPVQTTVAELAQTTAAAALPAWPPECLAAECKFHIPAAKLYPLLNHLVLTPKGTGILLQVFSDRVAVHFKDEPRTCEFRPEEIAVSADARQAQGKPA